MSSNASETSGFPTILVPLDGSELAERALPAAEQLALATNSPVLLVQVIPIATWGYAVPGAWMPAEYFQTVLDNEDRDARQYLSHAAERLVAAGVQVQTLALRGDPASTLIDLQSPHRIGLIAMATHGRTGLARFALGSVADRVARTGQAPVLLVHPFGEERRSARLGRALVPLDGSPTAEQVLPVVSVLAGSVLHQVQLVRVIDPDVHSGETTEAEHSLDAARTRLLEQQGGRNFAIETAILYGRPAEQIIERAEHERFDLVIMATHGRTGAERWAYGSVADRVLHGLRIPLLLVRARFP